MQVTLKFKDEKQLYRFMSLLTYFYNDLGNITHYYKKSLRSAIDLDMDLIENIFAQLDKQCEH